VVEAAVAAALTDAHRHLVVYTHNSVARILVAVASGIGPRGYIRFKQGFGSWSRIDFEPSIDPSDPWAASVVAWSNRSPPLR
jgi:broad specificity phosphatase PhoE